jgi:hypothetical protein
MVAGIVFGKHIAPVFGRETKNEEYGMIDFVLAGMMYLALMFAVLFCFSFVTIGITYVAASFIRRCLHWVRQPNYAIK